MGGHYHKYMQLEYDGIPGILCRSNLRAKEKTGGYSLCEVTLDSIFIYEHKIGNVPTRKGAYSMTGMNYPKSNAGFLVLITRLTKSSRKFRSNGSSEADMKYSPHLPIGIKKFT